MFKIYEDVLYYKSNTIVMKKIFNKFEKQKLIHKLHQLQKRLNRAIENNYSKEKVDDRLRKIKKIKEYIKNSRK